MESRQTPQEMDNHHQVPQRMIIHPALQEMDNHQAPRRTIIHLTLPEMDNHPTPLEMDSPQTVPETVNLQALPEMVPHNSRTREEVKNPSAETLEEIPDPSKIKIRIREIKLRNQLIMEMANMTNTCQH